MTDKIDYGNESTIKIWSDVYTSSQKNILYEITLECLEDLIKTAKDEKLVAPLEIANNGGNMYISKVYLSTNYILKEFDSTKTSNKVIVESEYFNIMKKYNILPNTLVEIKNKLLANCAIFDFEVKAKEVSIWSDVYTSSQKEYLTSIALNGLNNLIETAKIQGLVKDIHLGKSGKFNQFNLYLLQNNILVEEETNVFGQSSLSKHNFTPTIVPKEIYSQIVQKYQLNPDYLIDLNNKLLAH
jgi:hypothetical protein